MKINKTAIIIEIIFGLSIFYFYSFGSFLKEIPKEYLTILIFLFATMIGVFISKQGRRYNLIVKDLTDFNGHLSYQYRGMEIIDLKYQNEIANIIKNHYKDFDKESVAWDWFINEKSTLLTDITRLHIKIQNENEINKLGNNFLNRSQASLLELQKIRKNLIPVIKERIPFISWAMISLLSIALIFGIFSLESYHNFSASILKALFLSSILTILISLYKMNELNFYEEKPAASSVNDLLEIIDGKK